ncbi:MAG: hypothetical protein ACI4BB_13365, partial [Coprococcus sp.]
MRILQKIGRFYSRIIMKNVGIFIFIGLLSVIFGNRGWFPNKDIYAISQLVYVYVVPVMIAYAGGRAIGGERAGVLGCLAVTGVMISNYHAGLFGAMILGPFAGILWKWWTRFLEEKVSGSMQMLMHNLCIAAGGAMLALFGCFLVSPALDIGMSFVYRGMDFLIVHRMEGLLSLIIEPAKIFFLNNLVNHGILVPLAMTQLEETGHSILFLLETNPGPGFGLLAALYWHSRKQRSEYGASMFAQLVGGIHEVYFPCVLADMRLLLALIAGGMAGNFCFSLLDAGVEGIVSPGSLIILVLMAGRDTVLPVLTGVFASALVSFAVSIFILHIHSSSDHENIKEKQEEQQEVTVQKKIERIVFVCDGGVGSSAMGAAIFRRSLAQKGITGITVEAFAADLVPEDVDVLVCQKDYSRMLPETLKNKQIYTVDNLVSTTVYEGLIEQIQR